VAGRVIAEVPDLSTLRVTAKLEEASAAGAGSARDRPRDAVPTGVDQEDRRITALARQFCGRRSASR
jgi:hypothetical protein